MSNTPIPEAEATALAMLRTYGETGVLVAIESRISEARDADDHDGLIFWYIVRQAVDTLLLHCRPSNAAIH
jgi:hypothetical protein